MISLKEGKYDAYVGAVSFFHLVGPFKAPKVWPASKKTGENIHFPIFQRVDTRSGDNDFVNKSTFVEGVK